MKETINRPVCLSGPSYFKKLSDHRPVKIEWSDVLVMVREDPTVKHNTELAIAARSRNDKKSYDIYKQLSGAITPSVRCSGGHALSNVHNFTGYVCADFDGIESQAVLLAAKAKLSALPYVMLCWVTASQHGLRVIVPFGTTRGNDLDGLELSVSLFKRIWGIVNQALRQVAGIPFDDKVNDPTRLSFISHDAAVYYNDKATAFPVDVVLMGSTPTLHKSDGTAHGTKCIDVEQCFRAAVEIVEQREGQRYAEGNRNNYVLRLSCVMNRLGVMFDQTLDYCQSHYGDLDGEELQRTVKSAYNHDDEFGIWQHADNIHIGKKGQGGVRQQMAQYDEVEAFLRQHYEGRKNEITNTVEWRRKGDTLFTDLHDYELNSIWRHVSISLNKQVAVNTVWNTLNSDFSPLHNPLVEFLTHGTRPWQEDRDPDYVAQLAAHVHTTVAPEFFATCLKKWMVGIVASIMSPMKNQTALVIVGPQGIGKTMWCNKLWPNTETMKRYFLCTANTDFSNKDMRLAFTEFGLICLDEIDQLNSRELNSLKSLMTAESMQERAAYERTKTRRSHCASVCGTGNDKQFLTDTTGNRRWLVFECKEIDDAVHMTVDYEGLYGQLYALWQSGFPHWFSAKETAKLEEYLSQFEVSCPEKELIQRYFYQPNKTYYRNDAIGSKVAIVPVFMTATEIMKYIADSYRGYLNMYAVGRAMVKLKYPRIKRSNRWGYIVVPRDSNEIITQGERDAIENSIS